MRDRAAGARGLGLKPEHYRTILDTLPDIGFFEIHAENYMGAGGPPHRFLEAVCASYTLSLHGVGLSIGGEAELAKAHLARLKNLAERYRPAGAALVGLVERGGGVHRVGGVRGQLGLSRLASATPDGLYAIWTYEPQSTDH